MSGALIAMTQPSGGMGDTAGGGAGDVVGPASATDNAVARHDGTTGKALQDSALVVPDAVAGGQITLTPRTTSGQVAQIGGSTSSYPGLYFYSSAGLPRLDVNKADDSSMLGLGADSLWLIQSHGDPPRVALTSSGTVALASGGAILAASSGTDARSGQDVGMVRDSAGVWRDTDAGAGMGKRLSGRPVEASTAGSGAPNLLAAAESRKLLTNEGAAAEAYHTLPPATAGAEFVFYCHDADGIRVTADAGDTVRIGATVSAAAGFARSSTVGSVLHLVAINATEWVAVASAGIWTIDT